jgi:hypothetical protein
MINDSKDLGLTKSVNVINVATLSVTSKMKV